MCIGIVFHQRFTTMNFSVKRKFDAKAVTRNNNEVCIGRIFSSLQKVITLRTSIKINREIFQRFSSSVYEIYITILLYHHDVILSANAMMLWCYAQFSFNG